MVPFTPSLFDHNSATQISGSGLPPHRWCGRFYIEGLHETGSGYRMASHLDEVMRQVESARERAEAAEGELKVQWVRVAEMWELLAKEYKSLRRENGRS
jgi:hypothetical protein